VSERPQATTHGSAAGVAAGVTAITE
jgi:hypothetical protein